MPSVQLVLQGYECQVRVDNFVCLLNVLWHQAAAASQSAEVVGASHSSHAVAGFLTGDRMAATTASDY